jgi:hypothetical protein
MIMKVTDSPVGKSKGKSTKAKHHHVNPVIPSRSDHVYPVILSKGIMSKKERI